MSPRAALEAYPLSTLLSALRGWTRERFEASSHEAWLVPDLASSAQTALPFSRGGLPSYRAIPLRLPPGHPRPGQLTLGRASSCDLVFDDESVSGVHLAFMQVDGPVWTVRDGGSLNGTFVDGFPLRPGRPHVLSGGERLEVGRVALAYLDPRGLFDWLSANAQLQQLPGCSEGRVQRAFP